MKVLVTKEIVWANMSRVICMPRSWDRAPKTVILNRAPSRALNKVSMAVSLHATGMTSTYIGNHSEDECSAEDVDTRVGDTLLPPIGNKPVPHEHVELAWGLLEAVEAEFDMAHLTRAV
jgi:hypothetical protein